MVPGLAGLCSQQLVALGVSALSRLGRIGMAEPSPECAGQVGEKKKQVQVIENFELY